MKHAFGLVIDAGRSNLSPALLYLFAEPEELDGTALPKSIFAAHRREIAEFSTAVAGASVEFAAISYREWLASWASCEPDIAAHAAAIAATFEP